MVRSIGSDRTSRFLPAMTLPFWSNLSPTEFPINKLPNTRRGVSHLHYRKKKVSSARVINDRSSIHKKRQPVTGALSCWATFHSPSIFFFFFPRSNKLKLSSTQIVERRKMTSLVFDLFIHSVGGLDGIDTKLVRHETPVVFYSWYTFKDQTSSVLYWNAGWVELEGGHTQGIGNDIIELANIQ